MTQLAVGVIILSGLAFFVLWSFVPIGQTCVGFSLLAFITPLCGESDLPRSILLLPIAGVIVGILLLIAASSVKGCAVVVAMVVVVAVGLVYVVVSSDRTFPGSDLVRAAISSFTNPKDNDDADRTAQINIAVAATLEAQTRVKQVVAATIAAPTAAPVNSLATARSRSQASQPTPASLPVATPTRRPTPTPGPALTPTSRPTFTPRPTLTPTRRPALTSQWRPPTAQELAALKQLMLELTNAERAKYGAPPVKMGNNPSPQIHAEQGLANCYSAHWDLWGLKPLYRYALTGGDQYTAENGSGINYCPEVSENYRVNSPTLWADEVQETVAGWIGSPGHHRNLIDPRHTVLHAGIAMGKYSTNMVQVFSGDYVVWSGRPSISNGTLTAAGRLRNAFWDKNGNYVLTAIAYHPPTRRLTPGQLAGTYCLETDVQVGSLSRPLEPGWYYTDRETGRQYTDYTTYTRDNRQCINPYELPTDRPAPSSWDAANAQHRAAVELSGVMPGEESVAYSIVSERLDISADGREFSIRANLSPILSHYGPGIYTVTIWATTPDGEPNPVAQYPIWWHTEPTPEHPY